MKSLKRKLGLIGISLLTGFLTMSISACETGHGKTEDDPSGQVDPKDEVTLESIEITSLPNKVLYDINEKISLDGLVVIAHYSDGSTKEVSDKVNCSYNFSVSGEREVLISYEGKYTSFKVTVKEAEVAWTLAKSNDSLVDGSIIVIGTKSKSSLMGGSLKSNNTGTSYLESINASFVEDGLESVNDKVIQFTLVKVGDYYNLVSDGKSLGATAKKALSWDEGSINWSIDITSKGTYITNENEDFGRIMYNYNNGNPRYTTYSNNPSSTMLLPEIYLGGTAEAIYPTSISLSGNDEISAGKTTSLTVSYVPSNTNKKSVSWNSDNTSVATVNNGVVTGVSAGTANITATAKNAEGQDITASFAITVNEAQLDEWTIMLYLCGSDLESAQDDYGGLSALATEDITEILSVNNQPEDVNIIIETGGASKWSSKYGISNSKLGRYHVENKKLVKDDELTYASMGQSSTLQSFLTWGLSEYPAQKTGVILWNHGGAMTGVCFDELKDNDGLSNSEVQSALKNSFKAVGRSEKLEFIGYDACLMQVQDIAETNSAYFNYMVGSEESEAGEGWAYDRWVDDLYAKKDTEIILKAIADGFIDAYQEKYGGEYANDQTQSVLDLSKMANYKAKFEEFANSLSASTVNSKNFYKFTLTVKDYGDSYLDRSEYQQSSAYYPDDAFTQIKEGGTTYYLLYGCFDLATFDAKDFLTKLKSSSLSVDTAKINAALEALKEVILYNIVGEDAGNSNGLALVCPVDSYTIKNSYPASDTNFSTWHSKVSNSSRQLAD